MHSNTIRSVHGVVGVTDYFALYCKGQFLKKKNPTVLHCGRVVSQLHWGWFYYAQCGVAWLGRCRPIDRNNDIYLRDDLARKWDATKWWERWWMPRWGEREREAEGDRGGMKGRNKMKMVLKNDVVCFNTHTHKYIIWSHTRIYYLITKKHHFYRLIIYII